MRKDELENQWEDTRVSRQKTEELQENYHHYANRAVKKEEALLEEFGQSRYSHRFEAALDNLKSYRQTIQNETQEELERLNKAERQLEDWLDSLF